MLENPAAFFSHRHAAYFSDRGTCGTSNMLLTSQFGPRVRFASVLTDAVIPPDRVMTGQLGTRCMRCKQRKPEQ